MELEREVADLQLRLRASQQKEDAASLSQQQISSLKAQAQAQEKKVGQWLQNMIPCFLHGFKVLWESRFMPGLKNKTV